MLNFSSIPNARWAEFKNEIQDCWQRLSDADLEASAGDVSALSDLIAHRYGLPAEDARQRLEKVVAAFRRDDHLESAEEILASEQVFRDQFRQF